MCMALGKIGIAVAAAVIVAGSTAALPSVAYAQYYHRGGHGWAGAVLPLALPLARSSAGSSRRPDGRSGPILLPGAWLLRGRANGVIP